MKPTSSITIPRRACAGCCCIAAKSAACSSACKRKRWRRRGDAGPLEMYFRRGYVKVLLGIAKGKKLFDKRQSIKERDDKRNMEKALRRR